MVVNDHPFLVVNNSHATNHLALRRNILKYFETKKRVIVPSHIHISKECAELIAALLIVNPKERISFDDFFTATFLLPPTPDESVCEPSLHSSPEAKRPLLDAVRKQGSHHELF